DFVTVFGKVSILAGLIDSIPLKNTLAQSSASNSLALSANTASTLARGLAPYDLDATWRAINPNSMCINKTNIFFAEDDRIYRLAKNDLGQWRMQHFLGSPYGVLISKDRPRLLRSQTKLTDKMHIACNDHALWIAQEYRHAIIRLN